MKKIIVLGCGYLGYNIAMFFKNKYKVSVLGLKNEYSNKLSNNIKFFNKDLSLSTALDGIDIDKSIIINAIGVLNATNTLNDIEKAANEISLLAKIILRVSELNADMFVQLSSGGTVYGNIQGAIPENTELKPVNLYGVSKSCIEKYLIANFYENKLKTCILRVSNPYGGYQLNGKQQGIIPVIIDKTIKKEKLQLWSTKNTIRDYIYISDFLEGLDLIINKKFECEIYNLGTGIGVTTNDIIKITNKLLLAELEVEKIPSKNYQIESNILDINKIQKLGYNARISLEDGICKEIYRINNQLRRGLYEDK